MACPFCTHRLVKVEYRDEVALPWSEGEPGRGESCSRLSSASQPSCSRNAGGVYKQSVQCCDVAAVLRSNSCGMVKGTFNKTPTIYHVVFLRSWVATGVITLMELERYHAAVVFITVWPLFITLLLLGPLLCFPLGAKHSWALGIFCNYCHWQSKQEWGIWAVATEAVYNTMPVKHWA